MFLDFYGFLQHNLTIADKSSMRYGLELRVPLLDINLYEYSFSQEDTKLIKTFNTKTLLKDFLNNLLPTKLVKRPKTGFNPPLDQKINTLGKNLILSLIEESGTYEYLSDSQIKRIVDDHFSNFSNNTYKIWQLLYFSFWLKYKYSN